MNVKNAKYFREISFLIKNNSSAVLPGLNMINSGTENLFPSFFL